MIKLTPVVIIYAQFHLVQDNPELGLVQARWAFVNKDENLLTRLQNINLCFHFEVEQQVNGIFLNFFGFNGTAGVWRIKALEDSGGWLERTTVEDMDIAVRAHLNGWKFIYLNDVKVYLILLAKSVPYCMIMAYWIHYCLSNQVSGLKEVHFSIKFRFYVKFPSLLKLTGSNNIGGIQVLCSSFASAFLL